jgi:hypothetical protein
MSWSCGPLVSSGANRIRTGRQNRLNRAKMTQSRNREERRKSHDTMGSCKGSDHVSHANSTLVDCVDLATPLSLSSQPATGPSARAPAQRAGA